MSFKWFFLIFLISCAANKEYKIVSYKKECNKVSPSIKYLLQYQNKGLRKKYYEADGCVTKNYQGLLNFHKKTVGVIYSGESNKNKYLLSGIKKLESEKTPKNLFKIKKIGKSKKQLDKTLSDLIFKYKVGSIVFFGEKKTIKRINVWQKHLNIPLIYLGGDEFNLDKIFKVFPSHKNYAKRLVLELKKKQVKEIAILYSKNSKILDSIKDELLKHNIIIKYDIEYKSDSFFSMDQACREIFQIDKTKRKAEFEDIFKREKEKANSQGYKLNNKLVFLSGKVEFDAILIPDNFRVVNHFSRLFSYYQIPKTLVVGTHEWRSKDLLRYKNEMIENSFFVDFIGEKNDLPSSFDVSDGVNVIGPGVDLELIGYYGAYISYKVSKASKGSRSLALRAMELVRIKDEFFQNNRAFKKNEINWPGHIFTIKNNDFHKVKSREGHKPDSV